MELSTQYIVSNGFRLLPSIPVFLCTTWTGFFRRTDGFQVAIESIFSHVIVLLRSTRLRFPFGGVIAFGRGGTQGKIL